MVLENKKFDVIVLLETFIAIYFECLYFMPKMNQVDYFAMSRRFKRSMIRLFSAFFRFQKYFQKHKDKLRKLFAAIALLLFYSGVYRKY